MTFLRVRVKACLVLKAEIPRAGIHSSLGSSTITAVVVGMLLQRCVALEDIRNVAMLKNGKKMAQCSGESKGRLQTYPASFDDILL